ncbi:MAG: protein kinase, partial [Acidobacteriota bacterium]
MSQSARGDRLTPQRWQQIKSLIEQALEYAPGQRQEFLADACAGDELLYQEVEAFIAADQEAASFLEIPAHKMLDEIRSQPIIKSLTDNPPNYQGLKIGECFLGKYDLLRLIGKGGMGKVYQARHVDLGTMVAIKVLNSYWTQDSEAIERFKREARAAAKIEHPNTVRVFDYGVEETTCYLVMEYLEGESLRERLA